MKAEQGVPHGGLEAAGVMAARRALDRRLPVQFRSDDAGQCALSPVESARLMDAFGTRSPDFAARMLDLLRRQSGDGSDQIQGLNAGLAFVTGAKARTEVDALAAVVLYAANRRALALLQDDDASAEAAVMVEAVAALTGIVLNDCAEEG